MPSIELINASIFCCEKLSAASWLWMRLSISLKDSVSRPSSSPRLLTAARTE